MLAACQPCRCRHTPGGVSPSAHLSDGRVDLILVRHRPGRFHYLRYLMRTAKPTANPFTLPNVEVHRVRRFTFRHDPEEEESGHKSVWNCDGEIVDLPEIDVRVHRQLVSVMGTGIEPPVSKQGHPMPQPPQQQSSSNARSRAREGGYHTLRQEGHEGAVSSEREGLVDKSATSATLQTMVDEENGEQQQSA